MLKSERIILRGIRRDDLPQLWLYSNDAEVELLHSADPPMPKSLESMQARFDQDALKGDRSTWFAIETEGKLIGTCGLHSFDRFRGTPHHAELGIGIGDRNYWGRGYGREAVKLLLSYGFSYWNLHRIYLETSSSNARAIRCYLACGFLEEGRLREHEWQNGHYVDTVMMGILRTEWEQQFTS